MAILLRTVPIGKQMSALSALAFDSTDTPQLARSLLGKFLVSGLAGEGAIVAAPIVETEAYDGEKDLACHASKGRTGRTEVLFGPAGRWYVYLCYGVHEMLNLVTGPPGYPAAILIRGLIGLRGPGRLTRHWSIDRSLNGLAAERETRLWLEDRGLRFGNHEIDVTPRIGVDYAGGWARKPYRYSLKPEVERALYNSPDGVV